MVGALEEDGRRVESGWKEDGKEEGQKKRRIGKGGLEGEDGNKTEEGEVLISKIIRIIKGENLICRSIHQPDGEEHTVETDIYSDQRRQSKEAVETDDSDGGGSGDQEAREERRDEHGPVQTSTRMARWESVGSSHLRRAE